jgi:DoxX-like protein
VIVLLPPFWLVRLAVGSVWLYEGLWCKLLDGEPNQVRVVQAVRYIDPRTARHFLKTLGVVEVALAFWVWSSVAPVACAFVQTLLLVTLNTNGLLWARHVIHDPAGMVVKNFAFVVLAWVSASLPSWR